MPLMGHLLVNLTWALWCRTQSSSDLITIDMKHHIFILRASNNASIHLKVARSLLPIFFYLKQAAIIDLSFFLFLNFTKRGLAD